MQQDFAVPVSWIFILAMIFAALVAAMKIFTKRWIEGAVKARFDREIEFLKSDLRQAEAVADSQLKRRESEINALREATMNGRFSRVAILNEKKVHAAEKLWSAINSLGVLKGAAMTLSILKIDAVAAEAPKQQNLRHAIRTMLEPHGDAKKFGKKLAFKWLTFVPLSATIFGSYIPPTRR